MQDNKLPRVELRRNETFKDVVEKVLKDKLNLDFNSNFEIISEEERLKNEENIAYTVILVRVFAEENGG